MGALQEAAGRKSNKQWSQDSFLGAVSQSPNHCCASSGLFAPDLSWVGGPGFDFSDIPEKFSKKLWLPARSACWASSSCQASSLRGPELPAPAHLESQTQRSSPKSRTGVS